MDHNYDHPVFSTIVKMLATNLALMHLGDNIHGDLTSSNMMIKPVVPPHILFNQ